MILNDCDRDIEGKIATPATLNNWLVNNTGYSDYYLFNWDSVNKLGLIWKGKKNSLAELRKSFKNGDAVLLHVKNGQHWVLMTGINGTNFFVNDPGSSWRTSYPASEVVRGAIYARPSGCKTV